MKKILTISAAMFLIIFLPAAGVMLRGYDTGDYLKFPPSAGYVEHHVFSFVVFVAILCFILITTAPLILKILKSGGGPSMNGGGRRAGENIFPWWGYSAISVLSLSWIIAWTRMPLMHDLQRWTFIPLWLTYIVLINALCVKRSGRSIMTHDTFRFLLLFPLSAFFWWIFEYLNRFTNNWYYTGTGELSPLRYFMEATLAFSTVLPAVMSTGELVKTFPRLYSGLESFITLKLRFPVIAASVMILFSGLSLILIGIFPESLFPLIWISPLIIIVSLQIISGESSIMSGITTGDWRAFVVYPLAALICGFFWEMWNIESQAKWIYSIPFVQRFKIFEMPILGYAGYLPFGLQCAVAAGLIFRRGEEPWRFS